MLRLALVALALVVATATHAHRPPIGEDRAAFAVDDGCAPSPMDSHGATRNAWEGLWDGDDYREPYMLGRVEEGVTTWFGTASQSVFKSGRANIPIRLDDAYGWDRKRTFKAAARSLASLPGGLLQRIPAGTTLDLTNYKDPDSDVPSGVAYARGRCSYSDETGRECSDNVVFPRSWFDLKGRRPVPRPYFEDTLVHEFAHVLDRWDNRSAYANAACHFTTDSPCPPWWSDSEEWQAAMAESACAVSEYATTNNLEDFAESVVAWFGYYAGRQDRLPPEARDALRERLGKRFGVLNRLMHGRFDD